MLFMASCVIIFDIGSSIQFVMIISGEFGCYSILSAVFRLRHGDCHSVAVVIFLGGTALA